MAHACQLLQMFIDSVCNSIRIIPTLGPIVEQAGPPAKTPQFKGPKPNRRNLLMAFSLTDSQQTTLSVKFVDKKGNPAAVDGVPEWSTDNTDVLSLTPAADGMACLASSLGPLGVANVTLKADADLGAGSTPIIGTLEIDVTGGTATTVSIDASTPVEQP